MRLSAAVSFPIAQYDHGRFVRARVEAAIDAAVMNERNTQLAAPVIEVLVLAHDAPYFELTLQTLQMLL